MNLEKVSINYFKNNKKLMNHCPGEQRVELPPGLEAEAETGTDKEELPPLPEPEQDKEELSSRKRRRLKQIIYHDVEYEEICWACITDEGKKWSVMRLILVFVDISI